MLAVDDGCLINLSRLTAAPSTCSCLTLARLQLNPTTSRSWLQIICIVAVSKYAVQPSRNTVCSHYSADLSTLALYAQGSLAVQTTLPTASSGSPVRSAIITLIWLGVYKLSCACPTIRSALICLTATGLSIGGNGLYRMEDGRGSESDLYSPAQIHMSTCSSNVSSGQLQASKDYAELKSRWQYFTTVSLMGLLPLHASLHSKHIDHTPSLLPLHTNKIDSPAITCPSRTVQHILFNILPSDGQTR